MMVGGRNAGPPTPHSCNQPSPAPVAGHRPAHLRYIRGIDGLRAVSVLAVLVYHHYVVGGSSPGWLPGGFYGVEVFFVVSGYLITSLLLDERTRTGTIALKAFWFRRARRLLPALFLMLGVVILYSLLFLRDNAIAELKSDVIAAAHLHVELVADRRRPVVLRDRPAVPSCCGTSGRSRSRSSSTCSGRSSSPCALKTLGHRPCAVGDGRRRACCRPAAMALLYTVGV